MKKGYLEMDEKDRMALLEGVEDIISPEVQARDKFFKNIPCPSCRQDNCLPTIDVDRPFTSSEMLPKQMLVCQDCGAKFEPYTRIQVNQERIPNSAFEVAEAFLQFGKIDKV